MNKQEFFKALKRKLRKLKSGERKKYIEYYDEIISDIVESGVSEEEAVKKQGDLEQIAEEILTNTNPVNLRSRDWGGIVLVVASAILLSRCIAPLLFKMLYDVNVSTSVGIIGGADGPTSILIAGKIGTPWGLYITTAVVVIITIIYFVKKYFRK